MFLKLLFSQLCNKLLSLHMASLLHIQTVMSHMLHSYTFVLTVFCWDILTLISLSHTHIHRVQNFLSPTKDAHWLEKCFKCVAFPETSLKFFFVARHVLTLNIGKLMTSPATSLCQQCSNQAWVWHQQNCPSAFSSNGCHPIGDHRTWVRNEPRGDEWRRGNKGRKQRSSV